MAFKALFLSHAPDADYEKHKSIIDTGKYLSTPLEEMVPAVKYHKLCCKENTSINERQVVFFCNKTKE